MVMLMGTNFLKNANCACWEWLSVNLTGAVGALCAREMSCCLLLFCFHIKINRIKKWWCWWELTSFKMQIVHVGSDFPSTWPGLWEHCVQGNVVFAFIYFLSHFSIGFYNTCMQVHPWVIEYFFIVKLFLLWNKSIFNLI